jgi:hypothetical protein
MNSKSMRVWIALGGASLLAACGGGGGHDQPAGQPNVAWAHSAGGPQVPTGSTGVTALVDGSCVTSGTFEGSATFGAGLPNAAVLASLGVNDSFVAKYDATGLFQWARSIAGSDVTMVTGVASLPDGGFAVCGLFDVDATLAPGEANETSLLTAAYHDAFVAKYAADGSLVWVRQIGGDSYDQALGVAGLPDGSVAVAGLTVSSSLVFGAGELNETTLSPETLEGFVARYAGNGDLVWAQGTSSTSYALAWGVGAGPDNSVAVLGQYSGDTTFGAGTPSSTTLSSPSDDVWVVKYGPAGDVQWARTLGGPSYDSSYGIGVGADGTVVATGSFYESLTAGSESGSPATLTSAGLESMFVVRYDAAGTFQWARQATPEANVFAASVGLCPRVFADGGVAVAGSFRGQVVFGLGELTETHFATVDNENRDSFMVRFQPDGSLDWAVKATDTGIGEATGVCPLADGSFYFCGYYEVDVTVGAGDPLETHLTGVGTRDMVVGRANSDGGF